MKGQVVFFGEFDGIEHSGKTDDGNSSEKRGKADGKTSVEVFDNNVGFDAANQKGNVKHKNEVGETRRWRLQADVDIFNPILFIIFPSGIF